MKGISLRFNSVPNSNEKYCKLQIPLDISKKLVYLLLKVNDNSTATYRFDYSDAGTVGYAAMEGRFAITGILTNISIDWKKVKPSDFGTIRVNGSINNGIANLYLWKIIKDEK